MFGAKWILGIGAVGLAGAALYLLLDEPVKSDSSHMTEMREPALDDIDAESRSAMRDVLRQAGSEE